MNIIKDHTCFIFILVAIVHNANACTFSAPTGNVQAVPVAEDVTPIIMKNYPMPVKVRGGLYKSFGIHAINHMYTIHAPT